MSAKSESRCPDCGLPSAGDCSNCAAAREAARLVKEMLQHLRERFGHLVLARTQAERYCRSFPPPAAKSWFFPPTPDDVDLVAPVREVLDPVAPETQLSINKLRMLAAAADEVAKRVTAAIGGRLSEEIADLKFAADHVRSAIPRTIEYSGNGRETPIAFGEHFITAAERAVERLLAPPRPAARPANSQPTAPAARPSRPMRSVTREVLGIRVKYKPNTQAGKLIDLLLEASDNRATFAEIGERLGGSDIVSPSTIESWARRARAVFDAQTAGLSVFEQAETLVLRRDAER